MSETFVQGSSEWHTSRLGRVTASRVADVIAKTKSSGWGASRMNYMAELIAERLTGVRAPSYVNAAMAFGTETEPQARAAYEFRTNNSVLEVGFVNHPKIPMTGASPDGFVGDDGLVEIKCPDTKTHIDTLLGRTVPAKYIPQMMWQMACSGRKWCDFASFDPRLPAAMQLFTARIMRDDKHIAELEKAVFEFLAEVTLRVHELTEIYGGTIAVAA